MNKNQVDSEIYYQQKRPEMLAFIPNNIKTAIDFGCGEGCFSAELKKIHPDCKFWGVEINERAGKLASQKLDKVLIGSAVNLITDLPDNYFDCVIVNDFLEHIINPFDFLLKLKKKLSSNGVIVASIPNVRYIRNLKNLLINKTWQYENEGILDKTHLYFFTKKSIIEMATKLGFTLITIKGINHNRIKTWKFLLLNLLNILSFGFLSDTRWFQYAVVIKPIK